MATKEQEQALSKAKIHLMAKPDSVFFTTLCFSLRHRFEDRIPTACTDGTTVLYNPDFFMPLDPDERVFLLLHETMHCAYLHMLRLMGRNKKLWNMACDYVINLQLVKRGFKMPQCGLLDHAYDGMGAEEVYKLLETQCQNQPQPQDGIGEDLAEPGTNLADGLGGQDAATIEAEIQDALVRAAIQSKMGGDKPGTIPGDIEIYLNKLLNPKLPTKQILQRYLKRFDKSDYSYRKPNRRASPNLIIPGLHSQSLIDLAIAVDTSGSVTDEEFNRIVSEIAGILRMMKPPKISLIQFDTRIKSVNTVRNVNELRQVRFTGRGGTYIEPVLQWADVNKPELLLIFTDGHFDQTRNAMKQDVLWLIHDNLHFTAPYGKVVHYEI